MTLAGQCEQLVGKVELRRRRLAACEIELQPLGQQRVVRPRLLFMQGCQFVVAEVGQRKHRLLQVRDLGRPKSNVVERATPLGIAHQRAALTPIAHERAALTSITEPCSHHRVFAMTTTSDTGSANIASWVTERASTDPDLPAIKQGEEILSYGDLEDASARFATMLRNHGVAPGDRVAMIMPNVAYFPIVYYAILR